MSSTAPQSSDVHNQQVPPATHPASTLSEAFHAILSARVDLIVLAGFLSILGEPLLSDFAGSVINIHPALLPRHGGKGMYGMHVHREVIEQGDKESGCSVHYVTAGIDRGPIILQKKVPVHPDDTPETLQQRVHEIEGPTLVEALKRHIEDNADISQRV
jgi:phosphoribosylglycinamide formyltransferase-1